ncbi:F-box only protein 43-like [Patiria miniata]|uniref:Uncharacterized protein n=1 Tax=Patiria miniata TaxID=46514 RepID=A0A913ZJH3_PATMI|nr:F-box only protein 43-like [Patiria miniata]
MFIAAEFSLQTESDTPLHFFISAKMAEDRSILKAEKPIRYCLSSSMLCADQASRNDDNVGSSSSIPMHCPRRNREIGDCSTSTSRHFPEFTTTRDDESVLLSKRSGLVKETCTKITKSIQDDGYFSPNLEISSPANSRSQKSKGEDEDTTHQNKSVTEDFKTPHVPATRKNDSSMGLFGQTSSQKSLKVRTASEELSIPAAKKFTRIVPRDEVDGTPVLSGAKSLGLMYSRAMAEEDSGYSSPGMFAERPCKVGRGTMDIVTELGHHEPALLDKILAEFSDEDIVRFSGVCLEWRRIAGRRKEITSRKRHFLQQKSKPRRRVKENYPLQTSQRATVSSSTPLGEVQRLGEPQASSTPASRPSNHDRFREASESLLADESLTKCAKADCQSPANLLMNGQRGQCTRCGYDFCTNCCCEFHVNSVCPVLREKNTAKKGNGVGSGKSKRSLRRIARLESHP